MEQKIRESFAAQTMMQTLGAQLVSIEPGKVVIGAPILETVRQQQGFAHAAVAFAIGDSAAGYAALTVLDPEVEVVTSEMKINLLAPAIGDRMEATGQVIKAGKRAVVVTAMVRIVAPTNRDIAILQGTMMPIDRR